MLRRRSLGGGGTPLWSWWNPNAILVGLRVNILWHWGIVLVRTGCLSTSKQLETCFDMDVRRVQLSSSGICIKGIIGLIVA